MSTIGDLAFGYRIITAMDRNCQSGEFDSLDSIAGSVENAASEVVTMKLIVTLERDETGMIVVECPSIPGCVSQGRTEEEAVANIREAIQACVEARVANGMPITVSTREIEVTV